MISQRNISKASELIHGIKSERHIDMKKGFCLIIVMDWDISIPSRSPSY